MPIRVTMFGGIIPRLADRGLPESAAQYAMNAKLYSGELRAWNRLKEVATLPFSGAKTVFHFSDGPHYVGFDKHTYITKSALVNDAFDRVYYSNSDGVFVTTEARLDAADPPFKLGVPAPTGAFTVTPSGGTVETAESRVYLATLVSAFGEESAPTNPVLATGNADGTWTVDDLDALGVDLVEYPNIEKLRLYRTLTSATGVDYRKVDEWDIGARPATYVDAVASTDLASSSVMISLGWAPPPAGLTGLISVAGGFLVGFVGKTVRCSVPYYPHAWPEDFQFAVEDNIVGLGTFGNTVVIATEGRSQLLVGPTPDVMSLMKLEGVQPCLSARSLVSTNNGVLYATTDGLVLVDGSTNKGQIISRSWVTKDEWMSRFSPATQMASVFQDRYFSFYTSQLGFTVGFDDPITGFTELQKDGVSSVDLDTYTGQTLVTVGNKVYEWDGDATGSLLYTWRSKPFMLTKPANMAVLQLRGSFVGNSADIPVPDPVAAVNWSVNSHAIGAPSQGGGGSINGPATWQMAGTAPTSPTAGPSIAVKVYGDGALVWFGAVSNEKPVRLPSGYKPVKYEFEVQGTTPLFSLTVAETGKMLENLP